MSGFDVDIRGIPETQKLLDKLDKKQAAKTLQKASNAAAKKLKAPVKAEAATVSQRLAKSTSAGQARRDRPAAIVKFRPKVAYFRHFIVKGTQDHGPRSAAFLRFVPGWNPYMTGAQPTQGWVRATRVRGLKPNPIIARVADAHEGEAVDAAEAVIAKELE